MREGRAWGVGQAEVGGSVGGVGDVESLWGAQGRGVWRFRDFGGALVKQGVIAGDIWGGCDSGCWGGGRRWGGLGQGCWGHRQAGPWGALGSGWAGRGVRCPGWVCGGLSPWGGSALRVTAGARPRANLCPRQPTLACPRSLRCFLRSWDLPRWLGSAGPRQCGAAGGQSLGRGESLERSPTQAEPSPATSGASGELASLSPPHVTALTPGIAAALP